MIKVTTYNILHGYHLDLILRNLALLIEKGTDVICIQEAEQSVKNLLEKLVITNGWQSIYMHQTRACNLAIIWNPRRLTLKNQKQILLPKIEYSLIPRMISLNKLQRGAFSASFSVDGKIIRITNVHLAWEGGVKHRMSQLRVVRQVLGDNHADHDILVGDFNTFAPSIFRRIQEKKIESILGEWFINVFPNIPWTCDISHTAPQDGWDTIAKIAKFFGIKIRSRLDYIFVRNMEVVSAEMLDLPGSDRRPLMVKLKF